MARFSTFFHHNPPLEHDVFGNLQNPLFKYGAYNVSYSVIQFVAAAAPFTQKLDAEAKLGERYRADVKLVKRMAGDERQHFRLRS